MNITDVDDKIIRRARHKHLFCQYLSTKRDLRDIVTDVTAAIEVCDT